MGVVTKPEVFFFIKSFGYSLLFLTIQILILVMWGWWLSSIWWRSFILQSSYDYLISTWKTVPRQITLFTCVGTPSCNFYREHQDHQSQPFVFKKILMIVILRIVTIHHHRYRWGLCTLHRQRNPACSPSSPSSWAEKKQIKRVRTGIIMIDYTHKDNTEKYDFFSHLLFWNQILICLSESPRWWAISMRRLLVKYRLKWNSWPWL